jgi:hypothetical protein
MLGVGAVAARRLEGHLPSRINCIGTLVADEAAA